MALSDIHPRRPPSQNGSKTETLSINHIGKELRPHVGAAAAPPHKQHTSNRFAAVR